MKSKSSNTGCSITTISFIILVILAIMKFVISDVIPSWLLFFMIFTMLIGMIIMNNEDAETDKIIQERRLKRKADQEFVAQTDPINNIQTANDNPPKIFKSEKNNKSDFNGYKENKLREFDIVGAYYQNVTESDLGSFIGHAVCDYNEHDMYAVGIYNEQKQIGFTPRNNKRLNESIYNLHDGRIICWGRLSYSNYEENYFGTVYIPVGINSSDLKSLEELISLNKEVEKLNRNDFDDVLLFMKKYDKTKELKSSIDESWLKNLNLVYPPTWEMIRVVLKEFEDKSNWSEIVKLEKYCEPIGNKRQKEIILNKIKKATKNLKN